MNELAVSTIGVKLGPEWVFDPGKPGLIKVEHDQKVWLLDHPKLSDFSPTGFSLDPEQSEEIEDVVGPLVGYAHISLTLYYTPVNVGTKETRDVRLVFPSVRIEDAPFINEVRIIAHKGVRDIDGSLLPNCPSDGAYSYADVMANSRDKKLTADDDREEDDGPDGTATEDDSGSERGTGQHSDVVPTGS